ncbi:stromal antigen isoform X2 [Arctopsyche grandis]|uniref:stromal antigen isoform X2 n=1 Tax=Arctopsyche grandis TaxID=121162 RepID=UPI00406D71B5
MHRRGGKRIRMDDPPPEYENPMTPMAASDVMNSSDDHIQDPDISDSPRKSYSYYNPNESGSSIEYNMDDGVRDRDADSAEGSSPPPTPQPSKRITRSRGRGTYNNASSRMPPPASVPPQTPVVRKRRPGRPPNVNSIVQQHTAATTGEDETSLYFILRNSKISLNTIIDDWIESYKSNKEAALMQLMQFFINASGCKGKITPEMAQMEHVMIIRKMTEEFDEESGEYPLIMNGQAWKKFRTNFCDFIQTLVKQCQYSIIYDQFLMDNIISLLTGLSDSQVRAFRHTATLAVMKLMTALVDVALLGSINCDNCLRQYEAERLKGRDKRASDRLEVLLVKRQELEENMDEIKNMLSYMFKSVFVHRYRDTLPDIRAITMAEIGIWMEKFPSNFLDDLYLKYIGWTLHDKVGEVRLKCLQALQPLYSCEELKGKLELFTSKFKDRIVSMTLDKEYDVAVQAVKLVISILKIHHDILTDKDCEHVYELVYSSHRAVAQAAGEFLNVRLFKLEEDAPNVRTRRGKRRLPNTPLIRDLVQFFIESELHEHGAYLVDSLIESNPMMKDWECMTDLLLEEAGVGEEPLDNKQESSLIELMVCCARQAATGEPPVGRSLQRNKAHHTQKEQSKVSEDRQRLTTHFITTLPPLLEKYHADHEKLSNLISIPQYFDLEVYTTARQENNLGALLTKLKDIVGVHTESEVLETCGKTLEILCTKGTAIHTKCDTARSTITDMCVNRYKEAIDDWRTLVEGHEEPDADETFNVTNSLKKVSIMYMCHNLNNTNIWDLIFEDLPKCLKAGSVFPTQALVYCIKCCFFSITWSLVDLENKLLTGMSISNDIEILKDRLHAYIDQCKSIIGSGYEISLREAAYLSICDLLIYFSEQLYSVHHKEEAKMQELVYEPDVHTCDMLNQFVQSYVFVQQNYDERRIEELHKRRNFLAAYCKLIVYNVMPIKRAADIFKHYVKCYNDYGDIIKSTLSKAREISKMNCSLTMVLSLQNSFGDLLHSCNGKVVRSMQEFIDVKELAKRFALSFGLDALKNREAITNLHRAGITFAVQEWGNPEDGNATPRNDPSSPPPNLLFLEILAEFTNKLLKQDKRVVLRFLDQRIAVGIPSSRGEDWHPLLLYRNSLVHGESESAPQTTKRVYTRKRKDHGQHEDEDVDENADSDQDNQGY